MLMITSKSAQKIILTLVFISIPVIFLSTDLAMGEELVTKSMTVQNHNTLENGLSWNGLQLNGLQLNGLQLNGISLKELSESPLPLKEKALNKLSKESGSREILKVICNCALGADDELVVLTDDAKHTFPGSLGLAPEWMDNPLSLEGQRWVSACLLAHVNYFGMPIQISLRGATPALVNDTHEVKDYKAQEGAFFGNLFVEEPFIASCIGKDGLATNEFPVLKYRICATSVTDGKTICGFIAAGNCEEVCETEGNGVYVNCGCSAEDKDKVYEVITVYLK
jgi:hypothetical protein